MKTNNGFKQTYSPTRGLSSLPRSLAFEIPPVSFVAHQRFVAFVQLIAKRVDDGLPVIAVLAGLFLVVTDGRHSAGCRS